MYVGNSLSMCVGDILHGKIHLNQVDRIECGTAIPSMAKLDSLINDDYFGIGADHQLVREICEYLLFRGKFIQPRLDGRWKCHTEYWVPLEEWKVKANSEDNKGGMGPKFATLLFDKITSWQTMRQRVDEVYDNER